jgi:hypothetical protein
MPAIREPRVHAHLIAQYAREPDRLFGKSYGALITTRGFFPAAAVRRIDRIQHRFQAFRNLVCGRNLESNSRPSNLGFDAHKPLAHRLWRNQEGPADRDRIESQHGLQHERCMHVRIDGGMRTDEQQLETFVGQRVGDRGLIELVRQNFQGGRAVLSYLEMPRVIQQTIACGGQEPRRRILRNSITRPGVQGREQCVGERVFRSRQVARTHRKQRHETPVRLTRCRLDGAVRQLIGAGLHS